MNTISLAALLTLGITLLASLFFWVNYPHRLVIDAALPADFPAQGFSHASFEKLLKSYVTEDGSVDYQRWHQSFASVQVLNSYLAAISQFSPDNAAHRFRDRNDELAYWMYGYNAYVIKSVLEHWPLESVTDVKAPLEVIRGQGFFHQLRFSFGGEFLSLLSVENAKIRKQYKDPRIHFVLNCASESCPIARPTLSTGDALEQLLTQASHDFINDPANVEVDHDGRVLHLSRIFKWYKKDFVSDVRLSGRSTENGLHAYIAKYASGELAGDIGRASDYTIVFRDYDWTLNAAD